MGRGSKLVTARAAKGCFRRWLWVVLIFLLMLLQIIFLFALGFAPKQHNSAAHLRQLFRIRAGRPAEDADVEISVYEVDSEDADVEIEDVADSLTDDVVEEDEGPAEQDQSMTDLEVVLEKAPDPAEQDQSMTDLEIVLEKAPDDAPRHDARQPHATAYPVSVKLAPLKPACDGTALELGSIELHIIAWRRPKSLQVLLQQLGNAPHGGWDKAIPCYIHVDGGADGLVVNTAMGFRWPHGPVHLDIRVQNVGLRNMWLSSLSSAAQAAGPNSLLVVLEDDMRLSPLYFQWLMRMIRKYARNPSCREDSIMGISLSPMRMQEMRKPFTRWHALRALRDSNKPDSAFMSSVPSSWGCAYFTDRWMEFSPFVNFRLQPPYYDVSEEGRTKVVKSYDELRLTPKDLYIPDGCRSNVWPASWKRFMVDFMYARGKLMLYPSLPGERALATTLQLHGQHVSVKAADGTKIDEDEAGDSRIRLPRDKDMQRNARVAPLLEGKRGALQELHLPAFDKLFVTDLFLEPATRESVLHSGAKFIAELSTHSEYAELARIWKS